MVLDQLRDRPREVRPFADQLGEQALVLAPVVGLQGGAEGQAVGEEGFALRTPLHRTGVEVVLEVVDPATQFVVRQRELPAQGDRTAAVLGSHVRAVPSVVAPPCLTQSVTGTRCRRDPITPSSARASVGPGAGMRSPQAIATTCLSVRCIERQSSAT